MQRSLSPPKGFFHDSYVMCVCLCVCTHGRSLERVEVLLPSPSDRKDRELEDYDSVCFLSCTQLILILTHACEEPLGTPRILGDTLSSGLRSYNQLSEVNQGNPDGKVDILFFSQACETRKALGNIVLL